jgi:hypothetical protein
VVVEGIELGFRVGGENEPLLVEVEHGVARANQFGEALARQKQIRRSPAAIECIRAQFAGETL